MRPQIENARGAPLFYTLACGQHMWRRVMRIMLGLDLTLQKAEQRRRLLELDDDQLRDIGITREEALREARKGIWR